MTPVSAGALSRRPAPSRGLLGFAVAGLVLVAAAIAAVALLGGSGSSGAAAVVGTPNPAHPAANYGGIPKWLPKVKDPVDPTRHRQRGESEAGDPGRHGGGPPRGRQQGHGDRGRPAGARGG